MSEREITAAFGELWTVGKRLETKEKYVVILDPFQRGNQCFQYGLIVGNPDGKYIIHPLGTPTEDAIGVNTGSSLTVSQILDHINVLYHDLIISCADKPPATVKLR